MNVKGIAVKSTLEDFCRLVLERYKTPEAMKPGRLASEFIQFFGVSSLPTLIELHRLFQSYGFGKLEAALLPPSFKGFHHKADGKPYEVFYREDLWEGTQELVIAHELYEMVHECLGLIYPSYGPPPIPDICPSAHKFAAAVLMQPEVFKPAFLESGLDIKALHYQFGKAYSSVAIQGLELFKSQLEFLVAIYERDDDGRDPGAWNPYDPELFSARYVVKTSSFKLGRKGLRWKVSHYPRYLLPKKGDGVIPGSIVATVLARDYPVLVERVWGFDLWGWKDLAVIAQPVTWYGKVAKVIVVAVPYQDRDLLLPQVKSTQPTVSEGSYQLI